MKRIRFWEQIGLIFTVFLFWLIGNGDLLLLRYFKPAEWINLIFTLVVVYAAWGIFRGIEAALSSLRIRMITWKYNVLQCLLTTIVLPGPGFRRSVSRGRHPKPNERFRS